MRSTETPALADADVVYRPLLTSAQSESATVAALRTGDEATFETLVRRHQSMMLHIATSYVHNRALAEEIVQETWISVLHSIDRFEQRSSLKTWIVRILINTAKSRAVREGRTVPLSALEGNLDEPAVDADRFLDANHERWPGHWATPPVRWDSLPEQSLTSRETLAHMREVIEALPPRQREVIVLRDVEGWSGEEVCEALELSDANQRVLLHRARSVVRNALERYFAAYAA
jgi:RNA polymerase sigma-70 factor (ECF subfamily)